MFLARLSPNSHQTFWIKGGRFPLKDPRDLICDITSKSDDLRLVRPCFWLDCVQTHAVQKWHHCIGYEERGLVFGTINSEGVKRRDAVIQSISRVRHFEWVLNDQEWPSCCVDCTPTIQIILNVNEWKNSEVAFWPLCRQPPFSWFIFLAYGYLRIILILLVLRFRCI